MSNPRSLLSRPIFLRAAIAWAAVVHGAGCVQVVSLGSGPGEGGAGGTTIPFEPWLAPGPPAWEDIEWPDLRCEPTLESDLDGDGFSPMQGDCDDCDPDVGPDGVEMPTEGGLPVDEDCDGEIDEPSPMCDAGIAVDAASPYTAARALDLCTDARNDTWGNPRWGVLDAAWVLPDGSPGLEGRSFALGHGVIDRFGPNVAVRHGARMLALSTGTARQPTDPDYESPRGFDKAFTCAPPPGFPIESLTCPSVVSGEPHDGAALEIRLRAPRNAEAVAFDFNFYTYELPGHFCTTSNDLFVALLNPLPSGKASANVAFDAKGNLVSVNTVFLEACSCDGGPPCLIGGRNHSCALGAAPLAGTGFGADLGDEGDRGATGWLTSTTPVTRGAVFTLRFAIHDAADGHADSTVLLDHLRWLRREPATPRSRLPD